MDVMRSLLGMAVLLAIAFLLSVNKRRISLRTVGAAFILQVAIGGIMLYFPPGKWLVEQAAIRCLTAPGSSLPSGCCPPLSLSPR